MANCVGRAVLQRANIESCSLVWGKGHAQAGLSRAEKVEKCPIVAWGARCNLLALFERANHLARDQFFIAITNCAARIVQQKSAS